MAEPEWDPGVGPWGLCSVRQRGGEPSSSRLSPFFSEMQACEGHVVMTLKLCVRAWPGAAKKGNCSSQKFLFL